MGFPPGSVLAQTQIHVLIHALYCRWQTQSHTIMYNLFNVPPVLRQRVTRVICVRRRRHNGGMHRVPDSVPKAAFQLIRRLVKQTRTSENGSVLPVSIGSVARLKLLPALWWQLWLERLGEGFKVHFLVKAAVFAGPTNPKTASVKAPDMLL